jgi:hypothetical protein
MGEKAPDILLILESFLRENLGSKYEGEELEQLITTAQGYIRSQREKEVRKREPEPKGPVPRRPVLQREPDIEDKLLESLRQSIKKEDEEG